MINLVMTTDYSKTINAEWPESGEAQISDAYTVSYWFFVLIIQKHSQANQNQNNKNLAA